MSSKVAELGTTLGFATRVAGHVARERLGPRIAPRTLAEVPPSAEDLTREWLTAMLCKEVPNAHVLDFVVSGGSDGTSSRRALSVTYDAAGVAAGLPTALFTKSTRSFASRLLIGLTGIMRGEYVFYTDLRPDLDLRSPRSYGAAFDARSYRSIVLLEDLTAQGWTFPDPLTLTISRTDAEDMVSQLARYHGPLWDSPRLASLDGLRTSEQFQLDLNRTVGFDKRVDAGITRAQAVLPASIWRRRREVWPAVMRSLAINVTGPQTLLHQDLHPGNWLRDPEGRMGLYDWQCVGTGGWAVDYSYALTGLATDDRRAWERDLLALYLDELAGHGVPDPPSPDEAWKAYRQQPFHALAFGLFTLGRGMLQPRMQPDDYTRAAIQRIAQTVEDLESLDALD